MYRWMTARDVSFIKLQAAVFCVECELISQNNTLNCLSCGSKVLMNLSRLMGGSLLNQSTATLIQDAALDRVVRELLQTIPEKMPARGLREVPRADELAVGAEYVPEFGMVAKQGHGPRPLGRTFHFPQPKTDAALEDISAFDLNLAPAIDIITDRAQVMTRATGAAIALNRGRDIVCRARAGRTAPDLGVCLQTESGISGHCVRTGEILLCHDTESSPHVDPTISRRLGVRSILVSPIRYFQRTLGIFEVLSASPYAFDQRDVATLQLLSGMMVAAISRVVDLPARIA
jgi:GAF domain-containing protein